MTTVELDADSVASSPRSDHFHDPSPRVRFMCSFGGRILPRPHDNQLRYVGGDTRILALHRSSSFSSLLLRLSKLSGTSNITVKYQLPNEDLDALISVTTDEDVENMMEEYDRVAALNHNPRSSSPRLRLFLFPKEEEDSRNNSITSLLDGSANRESWFVDALNNNGLVNRLRRGPSEASSMLSEVPDYLFGLENPDDLHNHTTEQQQQQQPRLKSRTALNDTVSCSDPGSPAPVVSSPFCSVSSAAANVPSMPNLPPVKTKPDHPIPVMESKENHIESFQIGNHGGQIPHYTPESAFPGHSVQPVPVYYIPGPVPVQHGQVPVQPVTVQGAYVQPYPAMVPAHQVPVGYHHVVPGSAGQAYGGGMRAVVGGVHPYEAAAARIVPDGVRQYQAVPTSSGGGSVFPAMKMVNGDESQRVGAEYGPGRGPNME